MDWGILHLPVSPGELPPQMWADVSMNRILTVLMLVVGLLALRDYFRLFPLLTGCLVRNRGNLEIEHSVSQARNRNRCALAGMGILSLLADRYCLYPAAFLSDVAPQWRVFVIFGILAGFILFRGILAALFRKRRLDSESRAASYRALYNYFLALLPLILLSAAVLWLFRAGDSLCRLVFWAEIFTILMVTLFRESQILLSKYSLLQTFLYLCGLEFIPLAALVVPAAVL